MAEEDDPKSPSAPSPDGGAGAGAPKTPETPAQAEAPAATLSPTESVAPAVQPDGGPERLPANYFRAAGDPDEPDLPPDNSFPARLARLLGRVLGMVLTILRPILKVIVAIVMWVWGLVRGMTEKRAMRRAAVWAGWSAGGLMAVLFAGFVYITWGMPSPDDVWVARGGQSITFLDRNGNVILREGAENAPPVNLESLPRYLPEAFIAIEDRRFYQHHGVDLGGMMRAGATNLKAGRVVQGGSTLTQQLAKNLFLTNERSWRRKVQELALAVWLETKFSKKQLLALYLSRVYFGAGAYGIEAAAERYFDRPARELTLLQAATLAGLVKAPSKLNPARQDIAAARDRASLVLAEMVNENYISPAERSAALQENLVVNQKNPAGILGYFRNWIDPLLNDVIGQQRDDFIVETTLDIADQRAGARALVDVLDESGERYNVNQGALLSLDESGGVLAMVGGKDYDESEFNRTVQAYRQPGSSFKFFIYLAAMEHGLTPWTVRVDRPITIGDWSPGNYNDQYHGATPLTNAFAQSFNMVAIQVAHEIGGEHVIEAARRLGVTSPLENYRSLALGSQVVSLREMVQAYGAMASEGYGLTAHGVTRIRRANTDEVMWSWRAPPRTLLIQERELRYMNYMMSRVVEAGTGTRGKIAGWQLGGKTGTGNDYRDAWFIGFTPGIVAGVWMGNDNFTETKKMTGGTLPTEVWRRFMETALQSTPQRPMQMPGPEDFQLGPPPPAQTRTVAVVGAPIGAAAAQAANPRDTEDRSLDFGPEG